MTLCYTTFNGKRTGRKRSTKEDEMTTKQQKQAQVKLNKAMLLLLDIQNMITPTDSEAMTMTGEEMATMQYIHSDISKAISDLHWANGRL
jgi:hypothetical protein